MSTNPYEAPKAQVADIPEDTAEGNFISGGRSRPSGNGWQWITSARALIKPRQLMWIGIFIVFTLIAIAVSFTPKFGSLAMYFVMPVLFGGIMLTCDKARRGEEITISDLFSGFRTHFARLAGIGLATLLMYIAVFAVIAAIFGTAAALILSGFEHPQAGDQTFAIGIFIAVLVMLGLSVPIYMAVWFSYALVTINNLSVLQALKASFSGCAKNIMPFLVYSLIMLLLALAATIPFLLGWLILGPILFASFYTGYRDIFYET